MKKLILILSLFITSHLAIAGTIQSKKDFIVACVEILVPDAAESLKLDCQAQNPSEQALIAKYDLSSVNLSDAFVGYQRFQGRDYHMQIGTKVGTLFGRKMFTIDCRQDVRNPNTVKVGGYKPIRLVVENRIDSEVSVELACKAAR